MKGAHPLCAGSRNLAQLYRADTDAPVVRPYEMARRLNGAAAARPGTEQPGLTGNRASTDEVARVIDATGGLRPARDWTRPIGRMLRLYGRGAREAARPTTSSGTGRQRRQN